VRPGARLWGAVPLLAAALALPGAAGAQPRYGPYSRPPVRSYGPGGVVDGVIGAQGGRCMVLRDRQNRSYYLQGDTRGLRPGDQVTLRERMVNRSSCGNDGPTLEVMEVRTVWTNGAHRSAYFDARRDGSFSRFVQRNRDRGGWYSDRYGYMQQGGYGAGPYGDQPGYAPPNGPSPYDRNDRNAQPYPGQQPYPGSGDPRDQGPPPQYGPNNAPNGPGQPQYDPNGQPYDNPDGDQGYAPNGDDRSGDSQPIRVDGTLDFNGSCPAVRDSGGVSYDLAGNLRGFHNGQRVSVTGVLSGSSSCGGTALEIQEIRERR